MYKRQDKNKIEESSEQVKKLVTVFLILGIIIVSGFTIYYFVNQESPHVALGILNEDKKAEDYPTIASVNEDIDFYVTVENYLNREFTFHLKVLKGDEDTELSSKGARYADLEFTTDDKKLKDNEKWTSDKLTIEFTEEGDEQKIIVELWEITQEGNVKYIDMVYLRIDVET